MMVTKILIPVTILYPEMTSIMYVLASISLVNLMILISKSL